jgi:hypothetical protein
MVGSGRPSPKEPNGAFCGELASAIEETPATWAGTTFITTLETSGAMPPGA